MKSWNSNPRMESPLIWKDHDTMINIDPKKEREKARATREPGARRVRSHANDGVPGHGTGSDDHRTKHISTSSSLSAAAAAAKRRLRASWMR